MASKISKISNFIRQNKLMSYSILSGVYGFARSMNGHHDLEHDVIGDKLLIGMINGVMYSVPPYGLFYGMKLLNRIDIKLNGKDPLEHPSDYRDMFSSNPNVFI
jgi:hypothetical protein